jgi:large subunit ribosomal protein L5
MKTTKDYSDIEKNVMMISGQKPVVTKAKKAISNFKLREGMPNGITVTLRGERMYDFVHRLVNVTCPRMRDFRGVSPKAFDGKGNYSLGIKDCSVFGEINPDDIAHIHGVQVTVVTTAKDDESAMKLLSALNFPFKKQ